MPKKPSTSKTSSPRVAEPKVAVSYRLSRAKIVRAQEILGTPTATATIEEALDMVVFRRELMEGVDRAFELSVVEAFPDGVGTRRR